MLSWLRISLEYSKAHHSRVEPGAHTNLIQGWRLCVCLKVLITVVGIERTFMDYRRADQARAETIGTRTRGSKSIRRVNARDRVPVCVPR